MMEIIDTKLATGGAVRLTLERISEPDEFLWDGAALWIRPTLLSSTGWLSQPDSTFQDRYHWREMPLDRAVAPVVLLEDGTVEPVITGVSKQLWGTYDGLLLTRGDATGEEALAELRYWNAWLKEDVFRFAMSVDGRGEHSVTVIETRGCDPLRELLTFAPSELRYAVESLWARR